MKMRRNVGQAALLVLLLAVAPACGDSGGGGGTFVTGDTTGGDTVTQTDGTGTPDTVIGDTGTDVTTVPDGVTADVPVVEDTGTTEDTGTVEDTGTADTAQPDVQVEDVQTQDVQVEDVQVEDVQVEDVQVEDVQVEDVQVEDIQTEDVQTEDIQTEDVQVQDTGSDDTGNPPACDSIAALKATPEGAVDLMLCDVVVTYVFDDGYFIQEGPDGPATEVYVGTGDWPYAAPVPGDIIDLHVLEYGSFQGQQEITLSVAPTYTGKVGNLEQFALDLSAGTLPSEDIESRLVTVSGLTVKSQSGSTLKVDYGTATDVQLYITSSPDFCEGATFTLVQGVITEYTDAHQLRAFDAAADVANVDTTNCPVPPTYDTSNWNFEEWTETDPPADFFKDTADFTATQESTTVHDGASACNLTFTSKTNQDFWAGYYVPVTPATDATFSVWAWDGDPAGRLRLAIAFYDASMQKLGNTEYSNEYTTDNATWTQMILTKTVPDGAAFARSFVRMYDEAAFVDSATVYIDDWSLTAP